MAYLGKDGTSTNTDIKEAGEVLNAVRPYLRYIHSSQSINDIYWRYLRGYHVVR